MRVSITNHAVTRLIERLGWAVTIQEARERIREEFERSRRLRHKTPDGAYWYYVTEVLRMVVAEEQGRRTIITVLAPHEADGGSSAIPEMARELAAQFDAWQRSGKARHPVAKTQAQQGDGKVANLERILAQKNRELALLRSAADPSVEGRLAALARLEAQLAAKDNELAELRKAPKQAPPTQIQAQYNSVARKLEVARAHGDRMSAERDNLKAVLRKVVARLDEIDTADSWGVIAMIAEADPGLAAYVLKEAGE